MNTMTVQTTNAQGFLRWCRQHWLGALIGLACSAFVFDLIGPEILAKPFLCGRPENGKHIYMFLPESSFTENWKATLKSQPIKRCEPQSGWDSCYFDGPSYVAKYQAKRSRAFWSVVEDKTEITNLAGEVMATDLLYFVKPSILMKVLFPDYGNEMLCREMRARNLGSDLSLSFTDLIQEGK